MFIDFETDFESRMSFNFNWFKKAVSLLLDEIKKQRFKLKFAESNKQSHKTI